MKNKNKITAASIFSNLDAIKVDSDVLIGYFNSGNYFICEKLCKKYIEKYPNRPLGSVIMGHISRINGRREESVVFLKNALKLDDSDIEIHILLGMIYAEMNLLIESKNSYECALKLDPNSAYIYYWLANTLAVMKDYRSAEAHYLDAININPNFM